VYENFISRHIATAFPQSRSLPQSRIRSTAPYRTRANTVHRGALLIHRSRGPPSPLGKANVLHTSPFSVIMLFRMIVGLLLASPVKGRGTAHGGGGVCPPLRTKRGVSPYRKKSRRTKTLLTYPPPRVILSAVSAVAECLFRFLRRGDPRRIC